MRVMMAVWQWRQTTPVVPLGDKRVSGPVEGRSRKLIGHVADCLTISAIPSHPCLLPPFRKYTSYADEL